jgi:hypothetical protein
MDGEYLVMFEGFIAEDINNVQVFHKLGDGILIAELLTNIKEIDNM